MSNTEKNAAANVETLALATENTSVSMVSQKDFDKLPDLSKFKKGQSLTLSYIEIGKGQSENLFFIGIIEQEFTLKEEKLNEGTGEIMPIGSKEKKKSALFLNTKKEYVYNSGIGLVSQLETLKLPKLTAVNVECTGKKNRTAVYVISELISN